MFFFFRFFVSFLPTVLLVRLTICSLPPLVANGLYMQAATRVAVLEAALAQVSTHGWSHEAIAAGVREVGLPSVAHGLVHRGPVEVVEHFVAKANRSMSASLRDGIMVKVRSVGIFISFLMVVWRASMFVCVCVFVGWVDRYPAVTKRHGICGADTTGGNAGGRRGT